MRETCWDGTPLREALTKILAYARRWRSSRAEAAIGLVGLIEDLSPRRCRKPWRSGLGAMLNCRVCGLLKRRGGQGWRAGWSHRQRAGPEQKGATEYPLERLGVECGRGGELHERLGFTTLRRRMAIALDAGCPE